MGGASLDGRVVVVTGAAGGIGEAIALECLAAGATVVAVDVVPSAGAGLDVRTADLGDRRQTVELVRAIGTDRGRIDGLVSCAAIRHTGSVAEHEDELWDETIAVNLTAPFVLVREALPWLRASSAPSVVNVGSVVAHLARTDAVAYCAAKAGLLGLTRALAADLGPDGIRVNTVTPSFVATPMTAPRLEDEENATRLRAAHVLGRWAEGAEVARAVRFLLSDESSFITGTELPVDGGWLTSKRL